MEKYQSLRIVFMGTPEFAVASLDALVKAGCQVVGVITAPDKPAGRGMKLRESAVKQYAREHNLHVLQPERLKSLAFLEDLRNLKADIQVVVAFRMLPEFVWNMPPMGTVNLHGSLLPQYRGAAPIHWAVINGEKETGVTTFKLKHEIDTGNILLQERFPIGEEETTGEVHDRMKEIGSRLLLRTIQGLADGTLREIPQDNNPEELKHAPKIRTEDGRINWSESVDNIYNLVRGMNPYPGAFTVMNEKMLRIYKTKKEFVFPKSTEGDYETDGKSFLKYACANGYIHLLEVQMEGKKRMGIEDFLRGYRPGSSANGTQ